jgi:hypothetical protein
VPDCIHSHRSSEISRPTPRPDVKRCSCQAPRLLYSPPSSISRPACQLVANPDIIGIGIRVAIYVQNFLSFIPAFYALFNDGRIDSVELKTVEKQSTTILITAFAILISLIVQALSLNLSAFHTSIVLSLSWMNNTNTFIYFLLYIHHKSDPERGDRCIPPQWLEWIRHVAHAFNLHAKASSAGDVELNGPKSFITCS